MKTRTQQTDLHCSVSVWAVPNTRDDDEPFTYECYSSPGDYSEPYDEGAVRVIERDVTIVVPAGLDLISKALDTLREAQEKATARAAKEIQEIEDGLADKKERLQMRINNLLQLPHLPEA